MVPDRIFQPSEGAVVEERRLHSHVTEWRRAELIAIIRVTRDLFQTEILIPIRTIKEYVAGQGIARRGSNLRNTNHVLGEVTEHFIRFP